MESEIAKCYRNFQLLSSDCKELETRLEHHQAATNALYADLCNAIDKVEREMHDAEQAKLSDKRHCGGDVKQLAAAIERQNVGSTTDGVGKADAKDDEGKAAVAIDHA